MLTQWQISLLTKNSSPAPVQILDNKICAAAHEAIRTSETISIGEDLARPWINPRCRLQPRGIRIENQAASACVLLLRSMACSCWSSPSRLKRKSTWWRINLTMFHACVAAKPTKRTRAAERIPPSRCLRVSVHVGHVSFLWFCQMPMKIFAAVVDMVGLNSVQKGTRKRLAKGGRNNSVGSFFFGLGPPPLKPFF